MVVGELRAGFASCARRNKNEQLLRRFLDTPNVSTVNTSDATTLAFANISMQFRKSGTPIGTNDLWIAALAFEHNVPVLTSDSDFLRVKNIEVIKV